MFSTQSAHFQILLASPRTPIFTFDITGDDIICQDSNSTSLYSSFSVSGSNTLCNYPVGTNWIHDDLYPFEIFFVWLKMSRDSGVSACDVQAEERSSSHFERRLCEWNDT